MDPEDHLAGIRIYVSVVKVFFLQCVSGWLLAAFWLPVADFQGKLNIRQP
jgi:hypothetical protein